MPHGNFVKAKNFVKLLIQTNSFH